MEYLVMKRSKLYTIRKPFQLFSILLVIFVLLYKAGQWIRSNFYHFPILQESSVHYIENQLQDYHFQIQHIRTALTNDTQSKNLDNNAFKTVMYNNTEPNGNLRKHIHLQQESLFDILKDFHQFVYVKQFRKDFLSLSPQIDHGYNTYTSNNCTQLTKATSGFMYIKSTYNASCIEISKKTEIQQTPLSLRKRSLDIGLPDHFQQSSDGILWGFVVIVKGASVNTRGAVTSHQISLYSFGCCPKLQDKLLYEHLGPVYDEVFVITGYWGSGFYHALIEDLPRLSTYIQFLKRNPQIKVHAGRNIHSESFLSLLGLNPNRLVYGNVTARVAYMATGYPCRVSGILNIRLMSLYFHLSLPFYIFNTMPSILLIYRTTPHRMFNHYDGIRHMLYQEAFKRGLQFEVFPDNPAPDLLLTQQMFHRAIMVLGPHGAGLSNIVFCKPGTVIIEGLHHLDKTTKEANICFSTLALALGMKYHCVYFNDRDVLEHTSEDYVDSVRFYLDHLQFHEQRFQ